MHIDHNISLKMHQALQLPRSPWKPKHVSRHCSSRHLVFVLRCCSFLSARNLTMAGEGGVDIDLYAQVDEFEPEVAGQVRFREDFKRGEVQNVH